MPRLSDVLAVILVLLGVSSCPPDEAPRAMKTVMIDDETFGPDYPLWIRLMDDMAAQKWRGPLPPRKPR